MRPQNRQASNRQSYDTERGNRSLSPTQPLQVSTRSTGLSQLLDSLEAIEPGLTKVATQMEEREAEAQKNAAYAKAVADQVANNVDINEAAKSFSSPVYAETYLSTRYSLMASDAARDVAEHIEANKNRPDFDPEAFFQDTLRKTLGGIPEPEYQQMVAEKMGVLYGKFKQANMEKRLKAQAQESDQTHYSSVRAHMADLAAVGQAPTPETMELFVEQAADLNIGGDRAKALYLQAATDYAVKNKDLGFFQSLEFLRDDPLMAEDYDAALSEVKRAWETKSHFDDTAFAQGVYELVENGGFTIARAKETSQQQNAMGREIFSEKELARMVEQSRANRASADALNGSITGWMRDPFGYTSMNGASHTKKEWDAILKGAYSRAVEYYGDPGKAMKDIMGKLVESGEMVEFDLLSSQLTTVATTRDFKANPDGPPERFSKAFGIYRDIARMEGGKQLLERHIKSEEGRVFMETMLDNEDAGMSTEEAWQVTNTLMENGLSQADYMNSMKAQKLDNKVDDYMEGDYDLIARPEVRRLAHTYARYGYDIDKAIEKAQATFEESHVKIGNQWFQHNGSANKFAAGIEFYREELLKEGTKQRKALVDALGLDDEEFDVDEVEIAQHPRNPQLLIPMYEGSPVAFAGVQVQVNNVLKIIEEMDEKERRRLMDKVNRGRSINDFKIPELNTM